MGSVSRCRLLRPLSPRAEAEMHMASGKGTAPRVSLHEAGSAQSPAESGRAAHLGTDAICTEECVGAVTVPAGTAKMTETYDSDI